MGSRDKTERTPILEKLKTRLPATRDHALTSVIIQMLNEMRLKFESWRKLIQRQGQLLDSEARTYGPGLMETEPKEEGALLPTKKPQAPPANGGKHKVKTANLETEKQQNDDHIPALNSPTEKSGRPTTVQTSSCPKFCGKRYLSYV